MTRTVAALACHPLKSGAPVPLQRTVVDRWGVRGDRRWMVVEPDGTMVTARKDPALLQVRVHETQGGVVLDSPAGRAVVDLPYEGPVVDTQVWGAPARGRLAHDDGLLSHLLGREVRLLWCEDPTYRPVDRDYAAPGDTVAFADGFPLLLTTTASLVALQEWVDESCAARGEQAPALTMPRFRPSVVVDGGRAWEEQGWTRVRIGGVVFRAPKLCGRCVMPNIDLDTLAVGKEPLRTLAARNRVGGLSVFGVNLVPDLASADPAAEIAVGDVVEPLG